MMIKVNPISHHTLLKKNKTDCFFTLEVIYLDHEEGSKSGLEVFVMEDTPPENHRKQESVALRLPESEVNLQGGRL